MDEADKGVVGREYRGRSGPCRRLIPPTDAPDAQLARMPSEGKSQRY